MIFRVWLYLFYCLKDGRGETYQGPQTENRITRKTEPQHPLSAKKYQAPPNPQPLPDKQPQQPSLLMQAAPADPQPPNLMQKLTEMTSGDNSMDHILSKGKELIFMKFGLGK